MESDVTAESKAHADLNALARLEHQAAALEPSRGFWLMVLWGAALAGAYSATVLLTFPKVGVDATQPGQGYASVWTLLVPVLASSVLSNGAHDRFAIRPRAQCSTLFWQFSAIVGFIVLGVCHFAGVGYPVWLALVTALCIALTQALPAFRGLAQLRGRSSQIGAQSPLTEFSTRTRLMTVVLGLVLGANLMTAAFEYPAALAGFITIGFLALLSGSWAAGFGLRSVGGAWRAPQWVAFASSVTLCFVSVLLAHFSDWFGAWASIAAGVIVVIVMSVAAILPARSETGRPATTSLS